MVFYARLKCGTAEIERPERSELEALSAVATTGVFGFFLFRSHYRHMDLIL